MDRNVIPVVASVGLCALLVGLASRKDYPDLSNALIVGVWGGASFLSLMIALSKITE